MNRSAAVLVALIGLHAAMAVAGDGARAITADGTRIEGELQGNAPAALRFQTATAAIPLSDLRRIDFAPRAVEWTDSRPLRRFRLATGETLSGTLDHWTPERTTLIVRGGQRVELPSPTIAAIEMPDGRQETLFESFGTQPADARATIGKPAEPWHGTALNLSRSGPSLTFTPESRCDRGRVSFAFNEPAELSLAWGVELSFDPGDHRPPVRIAVQPMDVSYDVRFTPPAAATVHPLRRMAGWNRLSLQFGDGRVLVSVNGQVLATASAPFGELAEVRLWRAAADDGTAATPNGPPGDVWIDDLLAVRFTPEEPRPAVVPLAGCDALQRTNGDVLYGRITHFDPQQTGIRTALGATELPSREVAVIAFAAEPPTGPAIGGCLCRLEFQPLVQFPAALSDHLLVAIQAVAETGLTADHPFLGRLHIPLEQVRRLRPLFLGRRQLLRASAAHLGNEVRGTFAAPAPDGTRLDGRFVLEAVPRGPVFIRATVAHLSPASPAAPPGTARLGELRSGALLTQLSINGHMVGPLNTELTYRDAPGGWQDVRLRIAPELLRAGEMTWQIEQQPSRNNPHEFDDCEIGPIALEIEASESMRPLTISPRSAP